MPNVLEIFNQKEILDYLKERTYPTFLGEELFPEEKKESLEFDMLISGSRTPVIASIHGFDTETEIGQRAAQKKAIELALIKRKLPLSEKEVIALENPRTEAEKRSKIKEVFADFDSLVQSVRARVELMRMQVVAKGKITLDENGLDGVIDYGIPNEHKASNVDWDSADSDPIEDMLAWYNKMAVKPARALTSNTVVAKLMKHPKVIARLFGSNTTRIATLAEINTYLVSLGLPAITTYDLVYKKEKANGTYEQKRFFDEDAFVMFPAENLGKTIYGPTAEETRLLRDPSITSEMIGKILCLMYEEGLDPVATWEKAVATALPVFPYSDEIFQAEIKLS